MASKNYTNSLIQNQLLAALSADELARLKPHLELVSLSLGEIIYESGEQLEYVYFPITAIISLLYIMENGSIAEIGFSGNDGLVGIPLIIGGNTALNRAVVTIAGKGLRLRAKALKEEFRLHGVFQKILLRYTQYFMTQISQTAVCNRLHLVEQQLCRCLLINHDLLHTNKLIITHELIANTLGVRRETVSIAAAQLKNKQLIKYVRGSIIILDRKGLENNACECYKVVKDEYSRLFGKPISKKPIINYYRVSGGFENQSAQMV